MASRRSRVLGVVLVVLSALAVVAVVWKGGDSPAEPATEAETPTDCLPMGGEVDTVKELDKFARTVRGSPAFAGGDVGASTRLQDGRQLFVFGDTLRGESFDGDPFVRNSMLVVSKRCAQVVLPEDRGAVIPNRSDGVGYWPMSVVRIEFEMVRPGRHLGAAGSVHRRPERGCVRVRDPRPVAGHLRGESGPDPAAARPGRHRSQRGAPVPPDVGRGHGVRASTCTSTAPHARATRPPAASRSSRAGPAGRRDGHRVLAVLNDHCVAAESLGGRRTPPGTGRCVPDAQRLPPGQALVRRQQARRGARDRPDPVGGHASPTGPFEVLEVAAQIPSDAATGTLRYLPLAHPELLPQPGTVVVSYSQNNTDFQAVEDNTRIYRPRFLRVSLQPK